MVNPVQDQAEGLRRLLVQDSNLHAATVISGNMGAGKTIAVINLAAALVRSGKKVLIIDENASASNLGGTLGLSAHRDLLDVIRRDMAFDKVLIEHYDGFSILPAGRGMRVLDKLNPDDQSHLTDAFGCLMPPMDVILVDAAPGHASKLLSLVFPCHEIVVLVSSQPASITAAYALIKRISGNGDSQRFRVLVNKVNGATEAKKIFDNMARVANRYLSVSLDFIGFIPADDKLRQSIRRGRAVMDLFPASESAIAFGRAAESLFNWTPEDANNGGMRGFMQSLTRIAGDQSGQQHPDQHAKQDGATIQKAEGDHV
ncbi:MAG TPA: AAA family ATPase [Nitrosospira sp.]|nr:AAA family ATPase [Nitrosospira sp.]